jgi:NADPH-dependent glutamate synthase beta subunit-like oxidoreductase
MRKFQQKNACPVKRREEQSCTRNGNDSRKVQDEITITNLKETWREAWRPNHILGGGMYTLKVSQTKRRP